MRFFGISYNLWIVWHHLGTIVNIDPTDDVCGVVFVDDGKIGRLYILSIFITQLLKMLKCPRLPATSTSEDFLIQSWNLASPVESYSKVSWYIDMLLIVFAWDWNCASLLAFIETRSCLTGNIEADDGALGCLREMTRACASLPLLDKSQCAAPSNRNSLSLLYIIVTIFLPKNRPEQEGGGLFPLQTKFIK